MKTAIEKTDELLEQIMYCDFRTEVGIDKAKNLIRKAIKNQDRDTRHACAEAVLAINYEYTDDVTISNASSACINARAV